MGYMCQGQISSERKSSLVKNKGNSRNKKECVSVCSFTFFLMNEQVLTQKKSTTMMPGHQQLVCQTPRKTISMLPEHRRQDLKYKKVLFKQISEVTYSIDSVKRETSFIWENIQNLKSIIPDTLSCFFSFYIVL